MMNSNYSLTKVHCSPRPHAGEGVGERVFSAPPNAQRLPGVARRLVTFLASPRKVTKRRRSPIRHLFEVPCVARPNRRLWNSHFVLRQSSPTPPPVCSFSRRCTGESNQQQKPKCSVRIAHTKDKQNKNCVGTKCPHTNFDFEFEFDFDFQLLSPLIRHRVAETGQG